jgi:hypothetical protein
MGRTASHIGLPRPILIDAIRPARVTDLEAHAIDDSTMHVSFHMTGDDSLTGLAANAIIHRAGFPLSDQNFDQGLPVGTPPLGPPGTLVSFDLRLSQRRLTQWFAVRISDEAGNLSAVSNSDSASLPGSPLPAIGDLRVLAVTESTATLSFTGIADVGGSPTGFRISASTAPLDSSNVDAAPLQALAPATKPVGEAETTLVARITPGRRWRFAVRGVYGVGALGAISNIAEAVTPVGGALKGHSGMAVAARPQPAATTVTLDWQGDASGTVPQYLVVYDLSGRERRRIPLGTDPGGSYNWDGRDGESRLLPAGLYFVRLVSGARHAGSRVVFVR